MIIDCEGCVMRDLACGDCVVTFLLDTSDGLGAAEQTALAVLAEGGLVPPLRMQPQASVSLTTTRRVPAGSRARPPGAASA